MRSPWMWFGVLVLFAQTQARAEDAAALRLYHAPDAARVDTLRAALERAAAARGVSFGVYDVRDDKLFLEMVALEAQHGIGRRADVVLVTPGRAVEGAGEILAFLDALAAGTETLDSPAPQTPPDQVQTVGQPQAVQTPTAESAALSSRYQNVSAFQTPADMKGPGDASWSRTRVWKFVALFIVGLLLGSALSWAASRRKSPPNSA